MADKPLFDLPRFGSSSLTQPGSFLERSNDPFRDLPKARTTFGARATDTALGAARNIASALEPIQLPQEVFFSTVGSLLDSETSFFEAMRGIEWAKYAPGGEAPKRNYTGEDILRLMGVQDEQALKWGGIIMDFTVDPLLAGIALKVVGKTAKSAELIRIGQKIDDLSNPFALGRVLGGSTGARNAFGQWADSRTQSLLNAYRNPNERVFGIPSVAVKKVVDNILPEVVTSRLALGESGADIFKGHALSQQRGRDLYDQALDTMKNLEENAFGLPTTFFGKGVNILRKAIGVEKRTQVPQIFQGVFYREAHTLIEQNGSYIFHALRPDNNISEGVAGLTSLIPAEKVRSSLQNVYDSMERIGELAAKQGLDRTEMVNKFRNYVIGYSQLDASMGFHLSGYELIQQTFARQMRDIIPDDVKDLGFDLVNEVWDEVLRRGMNGHNPYDTNITAVMRRLLGEPQPAPKPARAASATPPTPKVKNNKVPRRPPVPKADHPLLNKIQDQEMDIYLRELVDDEKLFAEIGGALKLGEYLHGLKNGHLRRVFAMFTDPGDFNQYILSVKEGRVIPNQIVDEKRLGPLLADTTKYGNAHNYIQEYHSAVRQAGRTGITYTKDELFTQIVEQSIKRDGMTEAQATRVARDALLEMVTNAQPQIQWLVKRLRDTERAYQNNRRTTPSTMSGFFSPQKDLDEETLSMLGEFAKPVLSAFESASALTKKIPIRDFLHSTYKTAQQRGYVRSRADRMDRYIDSVGTEFVRVDESPQVFGAFAGKLVHPMLYNELTRIFTQGSVTPPAFNRVRSLITGGYLAAPNVTVANLAGGILTSALIGVNPFRLIHQMGKVLRPLREDGGRTYPLMKLLRQHVPIDFTAMSTQDIERTFRGLREFDSGFARNDLGSFLSDLTVSFQKQLEAPLGAKWAGLEGFQFTEKWLKLGTFRAELHDLIARYGDDVDGIIKLASENPERVKQAAEIARIAVFDYSELPRAMRVLRDTGVLMFPGFTLFMMGRTANAALKRPGVLAASDRISEALTNSILNEDERVQLYTGMPDYLKKDQGTPIFRTKDKAGDTVTSVIPMAQLFPTNGLTLEPFMESLGVGGMWSPVMDMILATLSGTGEAPLSGRFGRKVFTPETSGSERGKQYLEFAYNSFAPAAFRKLANPTVGPAPATGLLPTTTRQAWNAVTMPDELANTLYDYDEIRRRRHNRKWYDEVIGATLRATQPIALTGALSGNRREYTASRRVIAAEISVLKDRYRRAVTAGNTELAERIVQDIIERKQEHGGVWSDVFTTLSKIESP